MKKRIITYSILIFLLIQPLAVYAVDLEKQINSTDDDIFINAGNGAVFSTAYYIPLRSQTIEVIGYLRFEDITIPQGSKINEAILSVRTAYDFDDTGPWPNVSIYGARYHNVTLYDDLWLWEWPSTSAQVKWNVSNVEGAAWHNVTITDIVQEIVDLTNWTSGNPLAIKFLSTDGNARREFYDYSGNPNRAAKIYITYSETPADPSSGASPPYDDWDWEYNDTYRGFDIWVVSDPGLGSGYDVNWLTLNQSILTEGGSPDDIDVKNDTRCVITTMDHSSTNELYNDTGVADKNSMIYRFKFYMTDVDDTGASGYAWPGCILGFTETNTNPLQSSGNGIYIMVRVHYANDGRFNLYWKEQDGGNHYYPGTVTGWIYENTAWYWVEAHINLTAATLRAEVYNASGWDSDHLEWNLSRTISHPNYNFRYAAVAQGSAQGAGYGRFTCDIYSYLEEPGLEDDVIFITYPNGTLTNGPIEEDPEDYIDDLLDGPPPEDPATDNWGEYLTRFRFNLLILIVGLIMTLITPALGAAYRVDVATWIKILFVMFCGVGVLWTLTSM